MAQRLICELTSKLR